MSSEEADCAAWLRSVIEGDLALARRIEARWVVPADRPNAGERIWPASSVEALMVFRGEDPDVNAGLDLIRLCSPSQVVADCEAKLAILDEHGDIHDCVDWKGASEFPYVACRTVRLLASGYRHRPGYREEWKQ